MLFNSYIYILFFLPLVTLVYYGISALENRAGRFSRWWLVAASIFFYGFWDYRYLSLIFCSIAFNYGVGRWLSKGGGSKNKALLIFGIVANLGLLGHFKYANFFAENFEILLGIELGLAAIALPLAISFFTFQQIAFLVDSARGERGECPFVDYCLFVSFFPQLIAGPIVHHSEMMPQFEQAGGSVDWEKIAKGLFIFGIGLFKKVIIADSLAQWVAPGYAAVESLSLIDSWLVTAAYMFQLYFDFSGYSDMAIGSALIMGIVLPWNFQSPYKARTIQEFWRRWHMTLSRFLRDYLYIPLGGSRRSESRVGFNLFITFLLGGIWHGAGWTFMIWGAMHGLACVVHRCWSRMKFRMPGIFAWMILMIFINLTWVFFRATDFSSSLSMLKALFGFNGASVPAPLAGIFSHEFFSGEFMPGLPNKMECLVWVVLGAIIAFLLPSSFELANRYRPNWRNLWFTGVLISLSILNLNRVSEFLYFQF